MPCVRNGLLALAVLAGAVVSGAAQEAPAPQPRPLPQTGAAPEFFQSPILTLDPDRTYSDSLWGKRSAGRIEAASAELAAENRRIEADLIAEERSLTNERPTLPVEEFRKRAEAFDLKVTDIRRRQDAKLRAIGQLQDIEKQSFFAAAYPVVIEVLRSHGAVAILDKRAIFIAAEVIDITDEMIDRLDATIGAGEEAPMPEIDPADLPDPAVPERVPPVVGDGN